MTIPRSLLASCEKKPERMRWLRSLPGTIGQLSERWSLETGAPFDGDEVSCGWVAPASIAGGGTAVLKLGMPHMEGQHEIHGLRFWDGDPTVKLLEADEWLNAMLLERCEPGTVLRAEPETDQDRVIAGLLRRLWGVPLSQHAFRPLSSMLGHWAKEAASRRGQDADAGLLTAGLELLDQLPRTASEEVLLATDLHAENVLRAKRQPWIVIDPKPFVGDPAYDATQHLFNCQERLVADPHGTIQRFADLLAVDEERVRLWVFARASIEPNGHGGIVGEIARKLSP